MVFDPVCKMKVDEKKVHFSSQHKGKTYYFCTKGCKVAFDKDPDRYLPQEDK